MSVKKETLQCNTTKETLFVGVGGIGSKILARIANRCKGKETDNIKFVALDTNANDLKDIKNDGAKVTLIQTSSTQKVLDYLRNDEDARDNWFPNNTTLYGKTVSEGAGQVRAISRLALNATIKNGDIGKLYKAIDELFLKDGGELKQALRVVIVGTAAGGTGSGIAMTVGMLIREYLHKHYREKAAIIRGYLLLPGVLDTIIPTETERASLRRNGYATIKEVNAFMIKASGFCAVRKELERYEDLHIDVPTTTDGVDRLEGLPFDFCFLLDRVDKSQESMLTLDQYLDFAAQSLYEQNIGPMEGASFGIEDNIIKEFSNGDNLGRNRFGGIGASVLRYPYEDVVDYVAYQRAISCIGDGENVGEWLKYDKAYEKEKAEFKKKRAFTAEAAPSPGGVYIKTVNGGDSRFDNDIKASFAREIDKVQAEVAVKIDSYITELDNRIKDSYLSNPKVSNAHHNIAPFVEERPLETDEDMRKGVDGDLTKLRTYAEVVRKNALSAGKSAAKAIFYDAPSILSDKGNPFHLETLLRDNEGAMHPNAMRYLLYALEDELEIRYKDAKSIAVSKGEELLKYATDDKSDFDTFDVQGGFTSATKEGSFTAVCKLAKKELSFFEKIGGIKPLCKKLNDLISDYATGLYALADALLQESSYEIAKDYVASLSKEFESFYSTFETKVYSLSKAQDDIVEKLKFEEGDSISYVCASEECLKRWTQLCPTTGDDLMLPSKLNAKIFEAVKANAENQRIVTYDPALAKAPIDIFDTVLIDYFRESVREECDEILNINIIDAIANEQKFKEYFKAVKYADADEVVLAPDISDDQRKEYIKDRIKRGTNLAAPGIGYSNFCEPRDVKLCSYNNKLDDLRHIDMKKLTSPFSINAEGSPTVSKYDLRFFNAIYNITPDQLSRFRAPEVNNKDKNYNEDAGIYYQAYHDHIKNIGPDSTKCATISLHVDKRWDSLTEMPELSLASNYNDMLRIHTALVYGVIHGMIITTTPSVNYDADKRVFALEDSEGETHSFIVSNNTECDEFYEVLDALYRDRGTVTKILKMHEEGEFYDRESNKRYNETDFFADTKSFKIGDGHDGQTSVFEIPLIYYNTLPRSKTDDNELSIMVDSVISVLESEVEKYEREADRAPYLTDRLVAQFELFVQNFKNDAYNVNEVMRKNTAITDNRVVKMVLRKVCNKIKELGSSNFAKKIEELRALVK